MSLEVYFDESGTHDGSPFTCVAAYVFHSEDARALEREWSAALDVYRGKISHFHMVDCAHGSGEFSKITREERIELQTILIQIIKRRMSFGISISFSRHWYRELMPYHPLIGDEYQFGITQIIEMIRRWQSYTSNESPMSYIFENGHQSAPRVNEMFEYLLRESPSGGWQQRYLGHQFSTKLGSIPLQAADIFAWQFYQYAKRSLDGKPPRKDFVALIEGQRHLYRYIHYSASGILDLIGGLLAHNAWGGLQHESDIK